LEVSAIHFTPTQTYHSCDILIPESSTAVMVSMEGI